MKTFTLLLAVVAIGAVFLTGCPNKNSSITITTNTTVEPKENKDK